MTINDLLTLMDREQQLLADDNYHSAAALMREASEKIRALAKCDGSQVEER
jgi:CobQ-like glutamine amidotransferase family enzyme